jgi:formate dehydrogenase assembly factor FdhD
MITRALGSPALSSDRGIDHISFYWQCHPTTNQISVRLSRKYPFIQGCHPKSHRWADLVSQCGRPERRATSYAKKVKSDIPADQLEPAQARVDQLLEALRRETQRLAPDAESALTFHADQSE